MNAPMNFPKRSKVVYGTLGWMSVGLGLAGAFLPGLPTTVFVIAASYCFARSSPRFSAWLHSNRILGPRLKRYRETGGAMSRAAKGAALGSMWTSIAFSSVILAHVSMIALGATLILGAIGTAVILFRVPTLASTTGLIPELGGSPASLEIGAVMNHQ